MIRKIVSSIIFTTILILSTGTLAQNNLDLSQVDIDFCDGTNRLVMSGDADTLTEYCFILHNLGSNPGWVQLQIVDGEMTLGDTPIQACKTDSSGYFSQFVSLPVDEPLYLSGNTSTMLTGEINLPPGFAGNLYGCITTTIGSSLDKSDSMFTIVNRKANLMQFVASGDYVNGVIFANPTDAPGVKSIASGTNRYSSVDNDLLVTRNSKNRSLTPFVYIQNSGYVAEEYTVMGSIRYTPLSIPLFTQLFVVQKSGVLYGGDSIILQDKTIGLPWWMVGNVTLDISASHTPYQATDLLANIITNTRSTSVSLSLYPSNTMWIILAGLGVVLILIIVGYYIKKKKYRG